MKLASASLQEVEAYEVDAVKQLGRELSELERKGIRNACGGQMMELVARSLYANFSKEKLSEVLIDAGKAFENRIIDFRGYAEGMFSKLLGRGLTKGEVNLIDSLEYWTSYLKVFSVIEGMNELERSEFTITKKWITGCIT